MSLYLVVGALLILGTIYEYVYKKTSNIMYIIMFLVLTLMLCFRYGQGTDYFGYQYLYDRFSDFSSITGLYNNSEHSEFGWKLLNYVCGHIGMDFYLFSGLIGAVTMLFFNNFVQKFCPYKVTALLVAYPTLYLTYFFSAIRQGLIMSIFLGFLIDWYLRKKYVRYAIVVLLCATLHSSALVLLILLIPRIKTYIIKYDIALIALFGMIGIFLSIIGFNFSILGKTFSGGEGNISIIGVAERLVTFIFIKRGYDRFCRNTGEKQGIYDAMYYIYVVGTLGYCLTFSSPLVASRLFYFFKLLEILFISVILSKFKSNFPVVSIFLLFVIALSSVMLVKNIDSYISQGEYFDSVNVFNYPYHDVFTKEVSRHNLHLDILQD